MKVTQSCPTLWDPKDYTVHGILQARILEWVALPFSRGSFQPRDRTQVSGIAGRFFTSWATREAQNSPWNSPSQNTGVGRLALLQRIFPTQELNRGLPDSRRILYQPSNLRLIHYILIKYHKLVFHLIIYISPKSLTVLINKMRHAFMTSKWTCEKPRGQDHFEYLWVINVEIGV